MRFKIALGVAAAAGALALSFGGVAQAKVTPLVLPPISPACSPTVDVEPDAVACTGFYSGNLLGGSPTDIQNQKDALAILGFTWDGVTKVQDFMALGGNQTLNFNPTLFGVTYIGVHYGNGQGSPNGTAFYKFDFGNTGATSLLLHYGATSNARVYSTQPGGVPEPATWAMMIMGFGGVGSILRSRRKMAVA